MLLSHFKRLCITSATLIAASPLATVVSPSSSLPTALQQAVPSCAQSCVQASLAEKFPVACSGQEGIQCLCSHYSNMGESLGEVALGCVYSGCSMADKNAASAYNVCLGQRDAVMPTKTALTVVATSAPRTSSTSSSIKSIATPTITSTLQTQVRPTQSVIVDSISATPSATASPSPSFAAVASNTDEPPKMTPAQIAGLSVAAVAAFVIAVGLMALSVCLRRKKERKSAFDSDEKGLGRKSKKYSTRVSQWVPVGSIPSPPKRFPIAIPPAAKKDNKQSRNATGQNKGFPALPAPTRFVQRNGVGTSNSSSNSSLPLDQIGVAISEMDGTSVPSQTASNVSLRPQQPGTQVPFRPISTMTQITVFEEDETTARRRSSVLLPTPPVPVAPIRSLQPSKRASTFDNATGISFPQPTKQHSRQASRRSELFLDIPVRHERPQPRRIIAHDMPSTGSPKPLPVSQANRLAPPIQMTNSASPQRTPASSTGGDIDDYYFSTPKNPTPRASPAYIPRPRDSPKTVQIRSKRSGSTVSRTTSRASTNIRDSYSSQTSFETADPSDPTPEDEDSDKQLSDDKLSPVAESPISNLRYPKVPRASNQLVPRSPKALNQAHAQFSPRGQHTPRRNQPSPPSTSHLLQNRRKDLAPLLLETRVPLRMTASQKDVALVRDPLREPFTSPPPAAAQRKQRTHARSNSTESWTATPKSKIDRKSRTQSGMWPASPAMYDTPPTMASPEPIRPLKVRKGSSGTQGSAGSMSLMQRRRREEMAEINVGRDVEVDDQGLKSPVWVPRLTPTRKGEDLFISVGWGGR
ncbi:hypothetical protein BKA63DRAFT_521891 [Paraphoma chrysanthemicola]|nr:hypothetical protein BKA63DRAFT_521891 [Paraphoma chrysanthemicola]